MEVHVDHSNDVGGRDSAPRRLEENLSDADADDANEDGDSSTNSNAWAVAVGSMPVDVFSFLGATARVDSLASWQECWSCTATDHHSCSLAVDDCCCCCCFGYCRWSKDDDEGAVAAVVHFWQPVEAFATDQAFRRMKKLTSFLVTRRRRKWRPWIHDLRLKIPFVFVTAVSTAPIPRVPTCLEDQRMTVPSCLFRFVLLHFLVAAS